MIVRLARFLTISNTMLTFINVNTNGMITLSTNQFPHYFETYSTDLTLEKYNPNTDITPESIDKIEWYYLNSFMTHTTGGRKYIVDGQQRLTTLTLISIGAFPSSK